MPIHFQADADLNQIIVPAAVRRVPAVDFRTAAAVGLAGLADQEVLAIAARDGRIHLVARALRLLEKTEAGRRPVRLLGVFVQNFCGEPDLAHRSDRLPFSADE